MSSRSPSNRVLTRWMTPSVLILFFFFFFLRIVFFEEVGSLFLSLVDLYLEERKKERKNSPLRLKLLHDLQEGVVDPPVPGEPRLDLPEVRKSVVGGEALRRRAGAGGAAEERVDFFLRRECFFRVEPAASEREQRRQRRQKKKGTFLQPRSLAPLLSPLVRSSFGLEPFCTSEDFPWRREKGASSGERAQSRQKGRHVKNNQGLDVALT